MRAALAEAGVCQGDRVVAALPSGIEFAVLLFACMQMGVNLIPLEMLLTGEEVGERMDIAQPQLAFMAFSDHIEKASDLGCRTVSLDEGEGVEAFEEFINTRFDPAHKLSVAPPPSGLPILTIFTSGTTGQPKGVMLSEGNLSHAIGSINEAVGCRNDDVFLTALPFSHIYGINTGILLPMLVGGTSVLMSKFGSRVSLDAIAKHRVSVYNGVPSMYKRMARVQENAPRNLSSMRTGTIAGAKCSNLEYYQRVLHCTARILYGFTESPIIAAARSGDSLDVAETGVGRFLDTVEPRIVDQDGRVLGVDEVGEIACKSPGTMLGYLDNMEATRTCIDAGGWIHTGDLGYVDSNGYVHIVGRKVDVINRGGYKVYPAEIEGVYGNHPDVLDCCVLGLPHVDLGQQIVLFVAMRSRGEADPKELRDYAAEKLAKYKIPDRVIVLERIPYLANGKHDIQAVMELYEADAGVSVDEIEPQ